MSEYNSIILKDPITQTEKEIYLVKYEKMNYSSIRIGTLEYFRSMEGNQADVFEGRVQGITYYGSSENIPSQQDVINITGGNLNIIGKVEDHLKTGGSYEDRILRRCHNVHIYCCSIENESFPNRNRIAHFNAESCFSINNPNDFLAFVEDELWIKARTFEGKQYDRNIHYLKGWHAPVRYIRREQAIMNLPLNVLDLFVYQKNKKFEIEKEYRFSWVFFDKSNNKPVEAKKNYIDINCKKPKSVSCRLIIDDLGKVNI